MELEVLVDDWIVADGELPVLRVGSRWAATLLAQPDDSAARYGGVAAGPTTLAGAPPDPDSATRYAATAVRANRRLALARRVGIDGSEAGCVAFEGTLHVDTHVLFGAVADFATQDLEVAEMGHHHGRYVESAQEPETYHHVEWEPQVALDEIRKPFGGPPGVFVVRCLIANP